MSRRVLTELSIVMPCLNEARTLGECIRTAFQAIAQLNTSGEVVVADNQSSDNSVAIAKEHGARVVIVSERGYGAALAGGIQASVGDFILMGDADGSYDFGSACSFVDCLRKGDDLVVGNRFSGSIEEGAMPWMNQYIGNPLLTGLLNLLFGSNVGDAHCGLRAIRQDVVPKLRLRSKGMEFASEMIVNASLAKLRISEIPVVLRRDGRGRVSHLRPYRDGIRHVRLLLEKKFSSLRQR